MTNQQIKFYCDQCKPMLDEIRTNIKHIKEGDDVSFYLRRNADLLEWLMNFSIMNRKISEVK